MSETAVNPKVYVLIATIVPRKRSCEQLLASLGTQSRQPDGVILCLDGYGAVAEAPKSPLPVVATYRTEKPSGAGSRWRLIKERSPEGFLVEPTDILIVLDDDTMTLQAPNLIRALVAAVETGDGAAGAMGRTADGKPAPPGLYSRGNLIYAAGCGFAMRAGHLEGLQELADKIVAEGGPNALGILGDDDALVSAHFHLKGIRIKHAPTGNIFAAPGTRATSQTQARVAKKEPPDAQKKAIKKITGWPWPVA